jgi:D-alanyl-D-alanine carboxypeptidase
MPLKPEHRRLLRDPTYSPPPGDGPLPLAPGATACVLRPQGRCAGSAGVANVETGEPISADARIRIQSNSNAWLAVVVFQLAKEGLRALGDTVEDWLPGLLPYGHQLTVSQLMSDTNGLVDDNDMAASPAAFAQAAANAGDAELAANLTALFEQVKKDTSVDPVWLVRLAAWQPLVLAPGSGYHHSNIGWNIAGLIAERVAGAPLPVLYEQRIFGPLGLRHTSYQPQGPIAGPQAEVTWYAPTGA